MEKKELNKELLCQIKGGIINCSSSVLNELSPIEIVSTGNDVNEKLLCGCSTTGSNTNNAILCHCKDRNCNPT